MEGKLNINIAVRALISRIRVRCTKVGHEWLGEHRNINGQSVNWPFMLVQRANGCIVSHRRSRIDKNLAVCPSQQLPCSFCNVGVSRRDLDTRKTAQEPRGNVHTSVENDCKGKLWSTNAI